MGFAAVTLKVDNLAVGYDDTPLLEGLTFSLARGDIVWLQGANGSGKSTLLRTLAGLKQPLMGVVEIVADTQATGAYLEHRLGLKSWHSIREALAFYAQLLGGAPGTDQIDAAIDKVGLTPLAHRKISSLSAGQRQRAALARLSLTQRPVWFLDEPATNLDTDGQSILSGMLQAHRENGGISIIASHHAPDITGPKVKALRL